MTQTCPKSHLQKPGTSRDNACFQPSLLSPPNPRVKSLWVLNPTPCCRSQGPPCAASSESQEHVATGSSRVTRSHPIPSGTASPQPKKGKNLQRADVLHQQSPASSRAAATQLPKGQERQNPTWSSGQIQGSFSIFTTKIGSFKLQCLHYRIHIAQGNYSSFPVLTFQH